MTKLTPLIVWQKWVDPFGKNLEDIEWLEDHKDDSHEPVFEDEEEADDPSNLINEFTNQIKKSQNYVNVIATPMGIIPFNEHTASSKIFNFWVGHTNFNISAGVAHQIEDTDGVEILDIFTRYRFRIGIGKLFTDSEVMKQINDNVYEHLG